MILRLGRRRGGPARRGVHAFVIVFAIRGEIDVFPPVGPGVRCVIERRNSFGFGSFLRCGVKRARLGLRLGSGLHGWRCGGGAAAAGGGL
ncbi:hypothetical protein, partial [Limimaricola litoreus]|uniref:hypothetical protein n=1 Tax=Limimaricola litoreus TaxID=2955316 RepID=UPI00209FAEDC